MSDVNGGFSNDVGYRNFTQLSAFEEVFPIVIRIIKILQSCKKNNEDYLELVDDARSHALAILTSLADGYNKYHAGDKVVLYSQARSRLSNTQALLLVLGELGVIDRLLSKEVCLNFDSKIKMFNGLIKKMEDKA